MSKEQSDHFGKMIIERAQRLGDDAYKTFTELAKYLFAANSGAAAGMFYLVKDAVASKAALYSFYSFSAGVVFVGVSWLCLSSWMGGVSNAWSRHATRWSKNEISIDHLDEIHKAHFTALRRKMVNYGLFISFLLLVAGGVLAAIAIPVRAKSESVLSISK